MVEDSKNHLQPYEGDGPYVFICYSHADREVPGQIHWLQEQGINVWFDRGIKPGSEWTDALASKIEGCSQFLYFLSENSAESEHCRKELNFAEGEKKQILVVQLRPFELPRSLRLSLGNRQIIHKSELGNVRYQLQLSAALQPTPPHGQPTPTDRIKYSTIAWPKRAAVVSICLSISVLSVALWYLYLKGPPIAEVARQRASPPSIGSRAADPQRPTIAVLPFDNMSADPDQKHFVNGMVDSIITKLSMNPMLAVIARNSTFYYQGKQTKIKQIGDELGARYVVEGSVWKADGKVRVTTQLIDARSESHIWAEKYDRDLNRVFVLQDEIAHMIAAALNVETIEAEQARVRRIPTEDLTALDLYWRGLDHHLSRAEERAKGKYYVERAIELDPQYAAAYALLGWIHFADSDPDGTEFAASMAQKAIELDASLPSSYRLLAHIHHGKLEHDQAIRLAEKALSLNPNDAECYYTKGVTLNGAKLYDQAARALEKAIELNPRPAVYYLESLSRSYRWIGDYEKAISLIEEALSLRPDYSTLYGALVGHCWYAWQTGRIDDPRILDRAAEAIEEAKGISTGWRSGWYNAFLGWNHCLMKQYDKAVEEIGKALASSSPSGIGMIYTVASGVYDGVGRYVDAIDMLRRVAELAPEETGTLVPLGGIYLHMDCFTDAMEALAKAANSNLDYHGRVYLHYFRAILYIELGQEEKAQGEVAAILDLNPRFSLKHLSEMLYYKDPKQVERELTALRKAGLK